MLQLAVCDDEAACLRQTVDILRAALGDTPHQFKTFQNAPAMLAMLAEDGYRPDIAVLDICMGDMDGHHPCQADQSPCACLPRHLPVELRGLSHGCV